MLINIFNLKFLSITLSNILNILFPTFFFFVLLVSGHNTLATEIALNSSFLILVAKSLTANQRNLVLSSSNFKMLDKFIIFRLNLIATIFLASLIFNYFYISDNIISIIFILIFCGQWIIEICLVKSELEDNKKINTIYLLVNVIFFLSIFFLSFYLFEYLFICLLFYLLFILFFVIFFLKYPLNQFRIYSQNTYSNLVAYIKTSFFLSGFFLNLANFIWRFLIVWLSGKSHASIFIAIFSIGSFPGTVFNASFGPSMVSKNVNKYYLIFFFISYLLSLFLLLFFLHINFREFLLEVNFDFSFLIYVIIFTLLGSIIMLYALHMRQLKIQENPILSNSIFLKDIIISFFIVATPIILYQAGGLKFICFSYFAVAIFSFFIYGKKFYL